MKKINGRRKGHNFEREIANLLKPLFPNAERKLEYQFSQASGVDPKNTGGFKIQCKRNKSSVPMSKIEEIDEEGTHLLISKVDKKPIMVTLYFEDFMKLLNGELDWRDDDG